ncbi:hypothetical protein ZEAMMB73_Zm00001d000250 [Zea mays]|nr:hypothetical protein ZEAMMB73_Zm00001d000250 [Zea mays]
MGQLEATQIDTNTKLANVEMTVAHIDKSLVALLRRFDEMHANINGGRDEGAEGHGNPGPSEDLETKKTSIAVIIVVSVLASVLVVTALFGGFRYWQKKKRERDQAWFLKLFEERDDLEDELGLSNEF